MGNIIYRNLLGLFSSTKRNLIVLFLPVLLCAILILLYRTQDIETRLMDSVHIGVINEDDSMYTRLLVESFISNDVFSGFMQVTIGTDISIEDMFGNGDIDAVLKIPKDFSKNLLNMQHSPIDITIGTSNIVKAIAIDNIMRSYEKYVRAVELNATLLYELMSDIGFSTEEINKSNVQISYQLIYQALNRNQFFSFEEIINIPSTSSLNYFVVSILSLLILYFGLYVGLDVITEQEDMTFIRLISMGYSREQLMFGKIVSHLIYLITQVAVWVSLGMITKLIHLNGFALIMILFFTIFSIMLSVTIATCLKSKESFLIFGNVLYFLFAIIGGAVIPIAYLPQIIQKFSYFTPNYWFIKGMLHIQKGMNGFAWNVIGYFALVAFLLVIGEFTYHRYQQNRAKSLS